MKKKIIIISLVISIVLAITILFASYIYGFLPSTTSSPSNNITFNSESNIPTIPPKSNPPIAPLTSIIFDFDRGSPTILEGQNTPFSQTSDGVTASFSSDSDPAAFSIQSYKTTFYSLSQFSNKFLFDNQITRDILYIGFSQPLSKISFAFATVEYYGPGHVDEPSYMKLTAYKDNLDTIIGSITAQGNVSSNNFPQGNIDYNAQDKSFNLVQIEMVFQQPGGTDFLIDTIKVITA